MIESILYILSGSIEDIVQELGIDRSPNLFFFLKKWRIRLRAALVSFSINNCIEAAG